MYHSKQESPQTDLLCDALVALESREEAYRLLDDLCTIAEVQALAQRLEVARMLREITETYKRYRPATISRVNRCLQYGAEGYGRVLNRMDKRKEEC